MPSGGRALKLRLSPQKPFESLLFAVRPKVERRLVKELEQASKQAAALGDPVVAMVSALSGLCLRGGKRLRAALLAAGYLSTTEEAALETSVVTAAVAVELLHAYFLIHDDWMDRDQVRRGGPSVHALLTKEFRDTHRGAASAILAGDYTLGLATKVLAEVSADSDRMQRVWGCFARMQVDAVSGQQRDLHGARNVLLTYQLKTSSYTVQGPLELGALLGGAPSSLIRTLRRYAIPAGLGFQIRDDLLNAIGEPATTGKPLGSDLIEGKNTLVMVVARQELRGNARKAVLDVFGNSHATDLQRSRAVEALRSSTVAPKLDSEIEKLAYKAEKILNDPSLSKSGRAILASAITSLFARKS